jgi:hypothetical protein
MYSDLDRYRQKKKKKNHVICLFFQNELYARSGCSALPDKGGLLESEPVFG